MAKKTDKKPTKKDKKPTKKDEKPKRGSWTNPPTNAFEKGNPGGPGRPKGAENKPKLSEMLRDMRYVYSHPEKEDESPGKKACRQLLRDSPGQFLSQRERLEKALMGKGGEEDAATAKESERVECEVTEKIIESMDEWLARHQKAAEAE